MLRKFKFFAPVNIFRFFSRTNSTFKEIVRIVFNLSLTLPMAAVIRRLKAQTATPVPASTNREIQA